MCNTTGSRYALLTSNALGGSGHRRARLVTVAAAVVVLAAR